MISKTKYKIDNAGIEKLFARANITGIEEISPLGAGEYNAVFHVKAHSKEYVIKIAPTDDVPVLSYEKNMMASEVFWYEQMREHTSIDVPEVYFTDFEKKIIPANYFIMERLAGQQLDKMEFSEKEKADSATQTAKMAAQIHKIKNDKFGYIQNGLYDNWYQAIKAMVYHIIRDCAEKGKKTVRGEKLLLFIDSHKAVLEKAECCMVNFDIWAPNILCRREDGSIKYAWIDPERSFWGDRTADFVCLEMTVPLADKKASLEAYNSVADKPIIVTKEEEIRYAVSQAYLGLIMEAEKYFRYTPFHFGWWRNVLVSKLLFKKSFEVLKTCQNTTPKI